MELSKGSKLLLGIICVAGLNACAKDGNHSRLWYDMLHERQRQECINAGGRDCERPQSYDRYKAQRDEASQP